MNIFLKFRFAFFIIFIFFGCNPSYALFELDFTEDDDFSVASLRRGIKAQPERCKSIPQKAIWSYVDPDLSQCIKYWSFGLTDNTRRVVIFFHGDIIYNPTDYPKFTGKYLNEQVALWSKKIQAPYIFIGRPGTHGSSGNHAQRRMLDESRVISATLDELKNMYGITEFVIAGQSGGGHLTTSLLTMRNDIVCAVPTSAPNSPKIRYEKMGRKKDTTNYPSYEPTEYFINPVHENLRVIILGDPLDSNVFWESQIVLSKPLIKRSINHIILEARGSGSQRHSLSDSSRIIAGMCFHNKTYNEMEQLLLNIKG